MDRLKLFKLAPLSVQHRAFLHNFFCSTSVLTQFSVDQTLSQLATSLRRMPTLEHYLPIPPLFWGRMTTTWSYAAGLCGRGTTTGGRFFFFFFFLMRHSSLKFFELLFVSTNTRRKNKSANISDD